MSVKLDQLQWVVFEEFPTALPCSDSGFDFKISVLRKRHSLSDE